MGQVRTLLHFLIESEWDVPLKPAKVSIEVFQT